MINLRYIYSLFNPEDLLVYPESRVFDFAKEFNLFGIVDYLNIYIDLTDFTQVNSSLECTKHTLYSDIDNTLELGQKLLEHIIQNSNLSLF